jgi:biotin operon repressor
MSVESITWAFKQDVPRSTAKFVLVAMANCSNPEGICYTSAEYLASATGQDRKTVLENIKRLKEGGYLEDTGQRTGRTGQVPIYRLQVSKNGTVSQEEKRDGSENGTVPKTEANSPVFSVKQSRISAQTPPKTGHGNVLKRKDTKGKRNTAQAPQNSEPEFDPMTTLVGAGVPQQVAKDWLKVRRAKSAPLTQTAWDAIVDEAALAGIKPEDAVRIAAANSWQGFKASWLTKAAPGTTALNRQEALQQKNRDVAAQLAGGAA